MTQTPRSLLWIPLLLVLVGLPVRLKARVDVQRRPFYQDVDDYCGTAKTIHPGRFLKSHRWGDLYRGDRPPGFPFLLRAVQALAEEATWRVSFHLTFVLGLLVAPLAYVVGRRLVGDLAAFAASWWVAVGPAFAYVAASGISIELFALVWLLFLWAIRPGAPETWRGAVVAVLAAAAASLVRYEAALVTLGIFVGLGKWKRHVPLALGLVGIHVLLQILTGHQFSYRHGQFMFYHEFLEGTGVSLLETPRDKTYFEYLLRYHSPLQVAATPLVGFGILLVSLDYVACLPGAACLFVAGCALTRARRWFVVVALVGAVVPAFHARITADTYTFWIPHLIPVLWMAATPLSRLSARGPLGWRVLLAGFLLAPAIVGWACVGGWGPSAESFWRTLRW